MISIFQITKKIWMSHDVGNTQGICNCHQDHSCSAFNSYDDLKSPVYQLVIGHLSAMLISNILEPKIYRYGILDYSFECVMSKSKPYKLRKKERVVIFIDLGMTDTLQLLATIQKLWPHNYYVILCGQNIKQYPRVDYFSKSQNVTLKQATS